MKPVSADVDQLAWCRMHPSVERLPDGLIASSHSAQRVDGQHRVHDPRARAAVQIHMDANDGRREKRKQERRPDPPERVDDRVARREREKSPRRPTP